MLQQPLGLEKSVARVQEDCAARPEPGHYQASQDLWWGRVERSRGALKGQSSHAVLPEQLRCKPNRDPAAVVGLGVVILRSVGKTRRWLLSWFQNERDRVTPRNACAVVSP